MGRRLGPSASFGGGDRKSALAEEILREAYDRLVRACSLEGVPAADAADLAQDFFLWLAAHPERASLLSGTCIGGVVTNYVMRHRRRTHLRRWREGAGLDQAPAGGAYSRPATDETTISVQRLERLLPALEVRVLRQLRRGATWAEATAKVGVPPGSRDWLRKRMAQHVRAAFLPRRAQRSSTGQ